MFSFKKTAYTTALLNYSFFVCFACKGGRAWRWALIWSNVTFHNPGRSSQGWVITKAYIHIYHHFYHYPIKQNLKKVINWNHEFWPLFEFSKIDSFSLKKSLKIQFLSFRLAKWWKMTVFMHLIFQKYYHIGQR